MVRMQTGVVLAGVLGAIAVPPAANAQMVPDSVYNLEVLDPSLGPRGVVAVMRNVTGALGVRCSYCHVREGDAPYDYAADDKATKRKAREMFRMVAAINGEHLAGLPERSDPPLEVTCATCHHGLSRPVTLAQELEEANAAGGVDAVVARYRELREDYYGTWSYDFTDRPLTELAQSYTRDDRPDDALALLRVNVEFYPESPGVHLAMAQAYQAKGENATAIQHAERALELQPRNRPAEMLLRRLRGNP